MTGTAYVFDGDSSSSPRQSPKNQITGSVHNTSIEQWKRWEQSLTSSEVSKAYKTVEVTVTYTNGRTTFTAPAFWDGEQTWKMRCAFPSAGKWTWKTSCTNSKDKGLHNQSGNVHVSTYTESNPLYQHGYLRVSKNNRYLEYVDGTPFNWHGNTYWNLPWELNYMDWQTAINSAVEDGYNIIQIHATRTKVIRELTNRNGHTPFDKTGAPHHEYWEEIDKRIQYANSKGIIIMIAGLGKAQEDYFTANTCNPHFARYIVGRLYGNHVILSPSMDIPYDEINSEQGKRFDALTNRHLITQHVNTSQTAALTYKGEPYLDFCMAQSGHHRANLDNAYGAARTWIMDLYESTPIKPVINVEAMYGDEDDSRHVFRRQDARKLGYITRLSGSAGYTVGLGTKYGDRNGGLWMTSRNPDTYDYWKKCLEWPLNDDMIMLKALFDDVEWWNLIPRHERIINQDTVNQKKMTLQISTKGNLGLAYLPNNHNISIDMSDFSGDVRFKWFNPITGTYQQGGSCTKSRSQNFRTPAEGEWVLMLEAEAG